MHYEQASIESLGAAMLRAAFLMSLMLCVTGCEFVRTSVPYELSPDAPSANWAAARAACAREGRLPVMRYEWAVFRRQSAFHCELPGEMLRDGTAEDR